MLVYMCGCFRGFHKIFDQPNLEIMPILLMNDFSQDASQKC